MYHLRFLFYLASMILSLPTTTTLCGCVWESSQLNELH